jgi:hypothetical protein
VPSAPPLRSENDRQVGGLSGTDGIDPICAEIAGRGTPNIEDDRARRDDPAARGRQSVGAEKRKPRL